MIKFIVRHALVISVGLVLAFVVGLVLRIRYLEGKVRDLGFEKLELVARADSTRAVSAKVALALIKMYGAHFVGVEKLIVQVKRENTALGDALGQQTTLSADLAVMVRELRVTQLAGGPVTVDTSDDVRRWGTRIDSTPYHVELKVALPPAPRAGILEQLWIRVDTALVNAHSGCLERNADGLRPASLTLSGPRWQAIRLGTLTQDRDVCNPAKQGGGKVPWWFVPLGSLATLLGVVLVP